MSIERAIGLITILGSAVSLIFFLLSFFARPFLSSHHDGQIYFLNSTRIADAPHSVAILARRIYRPYFFVPTQDFLKNEEIVLRSGKCEVVLDAIFEAEIEIEEDYIVTTSFLQFQKPLNVGEIIGQLVYYEPRRGFKVEDGTCPFTAYGEGDVGYGFKWNEFANWFSNTPDLTVEWTTWTVRGQADTFSCLPKRWEGIVQYFEEANKRLSAGDDSPSEGAFFVETTCEPN